MEAARRCSIDACTRIHYAFGFCRLHYRRWKTHGHTDLVRRRAARRPRVPLLCSVSGCGRKHFGKGFCEPHYERFKNTGSPGPATIRKKAKNGAILKWLTANVGYPGDDCLLFPFSRASNGYGVIHIKRKGTSAHRFMCRAVHGDPPAPEYQAAHSCGRGADGCVNPRHLRWATPKANVLERNEHGTVPRGEQHPHAKLAAADIPQIRNLAGKMSPRQIAKTYGVSRRTILSVLAGKTWRDATR
jgi:hypothetical protein